MLHALLDANLKLPPEYAGGLTNHLPMALHALQGLGASPERLQDFYTSYARHMKDAEVPLNAAQTGPAYQGELAAQDWRALRGQPSAFAALLASFNQFIQEDGIDAALRKALPDLLDGVAAGAFHGLIRTAHAVQTGHAGELAAALAYWAWRWRPLPLPPTFAADAPLDLAQWAGQLIRLAPAWQSGSNMISTRMGEASRSAVYLSLAGSLALAPSLEARIAEFAALAVRRYVISPNFTVLHMVTALLALRSLLPWVDREGRAGGLQAVLAHNFTAAYLAAGVASGVAADATPVGSIAVAPLQTWAQVVSAAIASDDEHVIKLVHACQTEAAFYGEGDYLRAARWVVGAV